MRNLLCEIVIMLVLITLIIFRVFGAYLWIAVLALALDAAFLLRRLIRKNKRAAKKTVTENNNSTASDETILPPVDQTFFMSGLQFENYVEKCYSLLGYKTTRTAVNDQGIDLIVKKLRRGGLQIKCYAQPVSNKAVQEAIAGKSYYKLNYVTVVTNSIFTPSAKRLAKKAGVKLIDRTSLALLSSKARAREKHVKPRQ